MSITYSGSVFVALGIQHEMRVRHVVIYGLPRSTIFFPHYLINGVIFEKKSLITKRGFRVSVQILFEKVFIPRRNERDMIKNIYRSSCKVPFVLVRFK
jgi:hypothetical protein